MAGSFADYPIFTIMEAPEIETVILETPDREPSGTGSRRSVPSPPRSGTRSLRSPACACAGCR